MNPNHTRTVAPASSSSLSAFQNATVPPRNPSPALSSHPRAFWQRVTQNYPLTTSMTDPSLMLSAQNHAVYSRHQYARETYSQLRRARRLSANNLVPQALPKALPALNPAPAPDSTDSHSLSPTSSTSTTTATTSATTTTSETPSYVTASSTDRSALAPDSRPRFQDRSTDRPGAGSKRVSLRPKSSPASSLQDRTTRREREYAQNRALLAKRLRGSNPEASNSTSSLAELAATSSTVSTDVADSHAPPSPQQIANRRGHRRRASESSSYFAAKPRVKRLHSEHIAHHQGVPIPAIKRPISLNDFRLSKVVGTGGTATVVRAEPILGSVAASVIPVKEVALKAVSRKGLNRRAQHYLNREIHIHQSVQNHPHIASLYNVFQDSAGVYLAMELMRGSDLYTALKKERRGISEVVALSILTQILDALQYMHSMGCAHRDIKPENLMFVEKPNLAEGHDTPVIKLVDFGLACVRNPSSPRKEWLSSEKCGTVRYAAPEIVNEASYLPELCDIWSVGVVMYSMIANRNPYTGKTEKEVIYQIQHNELSFKGPEWDRVSDDTKNFIRCAMKRKSTERPTAAIALEEVRRIHDKLSSSTSNESWSSEDEGWVAERMRSRHTASSQQTTPDVHEFSSHATRQSNPRRGRPDHPPEGDERSSSPCSYTEDATSQPSNFFGGLVKAWFRGTSPSSDRDGTCNSE